jgi:hypothetical protein
LRALEANLSARLGLAFNQRIFSTKSAQLKARGTVQRVGVKGEGVEYVTSAIIEVIERKEKERETDKEKEKHLLSKKAATVLDRDNTRLTVVHPRLQKSREVVQEISFLEQDDGSRVRQEGVESVSARDAPYDHQVPVGQHVLLD